MNSTYQHTPIKVLAFDVFGTVVDWHSSVMREVDALQLGVTGDEFALAWRAGYVPAMARVMSGELGWTLIDDLHRLILNELLDRFGIHHLSEEQKIHLNKVWHRLHAWPDAPQGINQLKQHYVVCSLSNGNISLLTHMAKFAGLAWDCILSAEVFKAYKPDPSTYLGVAHVFNVAPHEVLMVAAHQDDLTAASACGLQTAYIERPMEYGHNHPKPIVVNPSNTYPAKDIIDLYQQLQKQTVV